ncbi:hypothetical protein ACFY64_40165 [Streptomyces collinus]|uniref:hypothetical protein n=1 Tax=Streptomyces collinus TaxID=42684 RepID=UPI00368CC1B7
MTDREHQEDVAPHDWFMRARIRIRQEHQSYSVEPLALKIFRQGEELPMVRWGRGGQEVEMDSWWTGQDISAAHIVPADKVEVLEVLEGRLPETGV